MDELWDMDQMQHEQSDHSDASMTTQYIHSVKVHNETHGKSTKHSTKTPL